MAGYTGREPAAVQDHVDELAAIGVLEPSEVPAVYDLDASLATSAGKISVPSLSTSGEVEPVFLRSWGEWFLTVGSDHTDRVLERTDTKASKSACPKVLSRLAIPLGCDPLAGDFDAAWDEIAVSSVVDGAAYQKDSLENLLPCVLLAAGLARVNVDASEDLAVFCGTVPTLTGETAHGREWSIGLWANGFWIRHSNEVKVTSNQPDDAELAAPCA